MTYRINLIFQAAKTLPPGADREKRIVTKAKRNGGTLSQKERRVLDTMLAKHDRDWVPVKRRLDRQKAEAQQKAIAFRLAKARVLAVIKEHDRLLPADRAVKRLPKVEVYKTSKAGSNSRQSSKQAKWFNKTGPVKYTKPQDGLIVVLSKEDNLGRQRRVRDRKAPWKGNRDRHAWHQGLNKWINMDYVNSRPWTEQWSLLPILLGEVPPGWMDLKPDTV